MRYHLLQIILIVKVMSMEIFEKIAKLRASLGLTRERFGEAVDISVNTIRAIETKGVTPKSDVLEKIVARWPCYALWLLTEEDAPLAGQFSPVEKIGDLEYENVAYEIIDVIDRNLDQTIVKAESIEKVIFLQTCDVPTSDKVERILNTTVYHLGKIGRRENQDVEFGTSVLLVIKGLSRGGFKRGVLVKSGYFDIREIESKEGIHGVINDFKIWFEKNGIKEFEINSVNVKTLWAIESELNELKISDLYSAPEEAMKSFNVWCESF
jgi:transcriptional regulator with XRE-family HTH domain